MNQNHQSMAIIIRRRRRPRYCPLESFGRAMWPAYRSSSPSSSPSFFLDVTYLSDSLTLAPRQKQIIDNNSSKNWNAIQVLQRTSASMNHWEGLNAMPII